MNLFSPTSRFNEMSEARQARDESPELEMIALLLSLLSASIADGVICNMVLTATISTVLKLRPDLKDREGEVLALLIAIKNDISDGIKKP